MKKERIKRSIVWSITSDEFKTLVKNCKTTSQICQYFNIGKKGGNYSTIRRRIEKEKIDTSHFVHTNYLSRWIPKEEFIKTIVQYKDNGFIKKKILEFELLKNECEICGQLPIWKDKPLTLQLDHKDGNRQNNNISNLRLLCPNCHTQTETYSMGQRKSKKYFCVNCNDEITKGQIHCHSCSNKLRRKTEWPDKETLQQLVITTPMTQIGRQFGVSDNAVRKWCKSMSIEYKKLSIK